MRNACNVERDSGYAEIVTLCCRGLDTLHANRTPHHQMKALICSDMLLSFITVVMALAFSSFHSTFSPSPSHYVLVSLSLLLSLSSSLVDVYALNVFSFCSREVLALKIGRLKENQDYACPRYRENGNEMEQH